MKKWIVIIAMTLVGCSSQPTTPQINIQTVMAETVLRTTIEASARETLIVQITETSRAAATNTPEPTSTPEPTATKAKEVFIYEGGWCIFGIQVTGIPRETQHCNLMERKQVSLGTGDSVTYEPAAIGNSTQSWCSIYKMDGTYLFSHVDTVGAGKATCVMP